MLDFFDEDFPLTKKQEEMKKAMEAAEKAALSDAPKPAENDSTSVNTPPVSASEPVAVEPSPRLLPKSPLNLLLNLSRRLLPKPSLSLWRKQLP